MGYEAIELRGLGTPVVWLMLRRPEVRNAFNDVLIKECREAFEVLRAQKELRVVVITGEGTAFCAGADLHWMGRVLEYTPEENLADSMALAQLLRVIFDFPKPVVGRINGPAIGGGAGLVAVCDIAIAVETAVFSFSEVKIGLVPACISPYVIKRVGGRFAREYFLTGKRLSAQEAERCGLVNQVTSEAGLDAEVERVVSQLVSSGPEALAMCKRMLSEVPELPLDQALPRTAQMITDLRMSAEGQEGMRAFLQKRPPAWNRP